MTRNPRPLIAVISIAMMSTSMAFAQASEPSGTDWMKLAMASIGGLALFLFGVAQLAEGLRTAAGPRVEALLRHATDGPVRGLATGTVATTILDSSSVTIILLIGLVDAGLLSFAKVLPVILGSNIGTTVSSQIFALGIDGFAPLILAGGLLVRVLAPSDAAKAWGTVLAGMGLVLFGLNLIGDAVAPLKDDPAVLDWLKSSGTPLRGVLIGAAFTVLIQSSSATLGVVITLASQGLIDLPTGLAMMLGAEIGTCADTLVATAGRSRAAVRAGLFHLFFNLITVALGVLLIDVLAGFSTWSSSATEQQIANAHVAFNVIGALIFLGITPAIAKGLSRLLPDRTAARSVSTQEQQRTEV